MINWLQNFVLLITHMITDRIANRTATSLAGNFTLFPEVFCLISLSKSVCTRMYFPVVLQNVLRYCLLS